MGIYEQEKEMVFVSMDGAVDANGTDVDNIIQLEKYRSIDSSILSAKPLTAAQLQKLGERLMSYNEPAKTTSILAWICGCFIKEHLRKKNVKFPHLMLIGEAGSGKSNTLERVIMPVFSRAKIIAAGQTTAFTLMKDVASSNVIPMALDEFKPSKIDKYRLDALLNHFRNSYDGQEGIRGRADQSIVSYELLAPLVVAGEESADEAAIRERSIELLFSKKDLKPVGYRTTFHELCRCADLLGSFGHSLLNIALKTTVNECYSWFEEALGCFSKELPSRIVNNLACMVTGLRLLEKLCKSLGLTWHEALPHNLERCTKYIEFAAKEYLSLLQRMVASLSLLDFERKKRMVSIATSGFTASSSAFRPPILPPRVIVSPFQHQVLKALFPDAINRTVMVVIHGKRKLTKMMWMYYRL